MKILQKQKDANVISKSIKRQHRKDGKKKECLRCLPERHNMMHNTKEMKTEVGDMVLIKGEEKSKGKWGIGIAEGLYKGKYNVIRSVIRYEHQSHT